MKIVSSYQRTAVPDERKDDKYWARRRKNNDAAKKSREMRRKKLELELKTAKEAITENAKLKQEIDVSFYNHRPFRTFYVHPNYVYKHFIYTYNTYCRHLIYDFTIYIMLLISVTEK